MATDMMMWLLLLLLQLLLLFFLSFTAAAVAAAVVAAAAATAAAATAAATATATNRQDFATFHESIDATLCQFIAKLSAERTRHVSHSLSLAGCPAVGAQL